YLGKGFLCRVTASDAPALARRPARTQRTGAGNPELMRNWPDGRRKMYEDDRQDERKPGKKQSDRRMLALLGLELTGLIVAAVAIGLIVGSCGEKREDVASGVSAQPSSEPASATVASIASNRPARTQEGDEVTSADSLPPEVNASVGDTLVIPGSAIEIDAQASVDATELSLWDGLGKRQLFTYDEEGKVWRAYYRVPLKSADRLGLSVTAKNGAGRWRRVWVFLHVERESSVQADSTR